MHRFSNYKEAAEFIIKNNNNDTLKTYFFTDIEKEYLKSSRPFYDDKKDEIFELEIQHILYLRNNWESECEIRERNDCKDIKYETFLKNETDIMKNDRKSSIPNAPFYFRVKHVANNPLQYLKRTGNTLRRLTRRLTATNRGGKTRKQKHKKHRR